MRNSAQVVVAVAALLWTSSALGAECPADQRGIDVRSPGPSETVGEETVALLGHVKLGQSIEDRVLRLRRITLAPGAQVGWHEHGDRSLLLFVESGTFTEYRSDCRVPISHPAGTTIEESIGTKPWWRNEGADPVVLLISDITTPAAVEKLNLPSKQSGAMSVSTGHRHSGGFRPIADRSLSSPRHSAVNGQHSRPTSAALPEYTVTASLRRDA